MAWTSPRTWSAGETVTETIMNTHVRDNLKAIGDAWASYTPALSNWTLGNGTLTGRALQAGKLVQFVVDFTLGSTTTPSGNLVISLPVASRLSTLSMPINGTVWLNDASGSANNYQSPVVNTSTTFLIRSATGTNVNATTPWTWANGDRVVVIGTYEAA